MAAPIIAGIELPDDPVLRGGIMIAIRQHILKEDKP
jgi:hypothetical protein